MLFFVLGYFLVEAIVGYWSNSLALIADACHMLSDGLCLVVALIAIRIGKKSKDDKVLNRTNTFGWSRAELMGGLINGVFLLVLCLIIFIESIKKLIEPSIVDEPHLVFVVGAVGLLMNVIQLGILDHGHSHAGHGHSHSGQHNMRSVYLHVVGDLFGSIVVMLSSGLTAWVNNCLTWNKSCATNTDALACGSYLSYINETTSSLILSQLDNQTQSQMFPATANEWIAYVDPITSLILTALITTSTYQSIKSKIKFFALKLETLLQNQ